jgi:meso-butanediol dehydrogenase/(S,S)-butanediol dehydrogenase/diacetyl reductase
MTMGRFTGRSALVTGAARGIGFVIASQLVAEGAIVVLADIDGDAAVQAAGRVRGPGSASGIAMDVTSRGDVERAVSFAARDESLDMLVSNVGVADEASFDTMSDEQWGAQVSATLTGTFLSSQISMPYLAKSLHGGRAVLVGSVNGLSGYGHEAYSAAKAGVHNLTANLAVRYGSSGIRVNAVAPGTVVTEAWEPRVAQDPGLLDRMARHYPLRTLGRPEDVAQAVLFLLSDDARWITGTVLAVDGGLTAGSAAIFDDRTLRASDE